MLQAQSHGFTSNALRTLAIIVSIALLSIIGVFTVALAAGVVGSLDAPTVLLVVQIVAFAAALITLPIGSLWSMYLAIQFSFSESVNSDVKPIRYLFNKPNALFMPSILTQTGMEIREKFLTALSYGLVGVFMGLLVLVLSKWTLWST